MIPPQTVYVNPFLIIFIMMVVLMGIGIAIYITVVKLVKNIKNRPKRVTHTYQLTPPGPPTIIPIGVEYTDTIQLKEPTTMTQLTNEWDW